MPGVLTKEPSPCHFPVTIQKTGPLGDYPRTVPFFLLVQMIYSSSNRFVPRFFSQSRIRTARTAVRTEARTR